MEVLKVSTRDGPSIRVQGTRWSKPATGCVIGIGTVFRVHVFRLVIEDTDDKDGVTECLKLSFTSIGRPSAAADLYASISRADSADAASSKAMCFILFAEGTRGTEVRERYGDMSGLLGVR